MNISTMDSSRYTSPINTPGHLGYLNLPLLMDYIPDDIVSKLKTQFGDQLYSITSVKHTATENNYVVRLPKNGLMQYETVDANGAVTNNK